MKKLDEIVNEAVEEALLESSIRETVVLNGKEIPFGHEDHIKDLQATLAGLERVRDCFEKGSGHRLTYAHACGRLRMLVRKLSPVASEQGNSGDERR